MSLYLTITYILYIVHCKSTLYNVSVSLGNKIINTTDEMFVSFNFDYYQVYDGVNYESEQLEYLARELSPAMIRVGGTDGDFAYYEVGDEKPCHLPKPGYDDNDWWNYTCLSMDKFTQFIAWSHKINAKIVWALSVGYPVYPNISSQYWNSTNSRQFLEYLHANNYTSDDVYGFGIGNEINDADPFTNATWQSNAFHDLNNILTSLWGADHGFHLIGPDPHSSSVRPGTNVTVFNYINEFFRSTCDILSGGDYHVYVNLPNSTDYITPNGLNIQTYESSRVMNDINYDTDCLKRLSKNIYVGEISPVNHQFEWKYQDMINKYWDGFWWLDALSYISKIGQKSALRWRLYAENSTVSYNKNLIGNDYIPNPDYYTTYLFKNIMGIHALDIESNNEYFRIYAQCTSQRINEKIYNGNNLTLVNPVSMSYVSLFNKTNDYVNINIEQFDDLLNGQVIVWILTPGNKTAASNGLESTTIALNDIVLGLDFDSKLPKMQGQVIHVNKNDNSIQVPGMTYGFIVFTETNIGACAVM